MRPLDPMAVAMTTILLLACGPPSTEAADVLTQHNDNARTGANTAETVLTTANVKPETFGRLWTLYADGQVSAQPLYISQVAVDTSANANTPLVRGTFNAVLVATMHNTVYLYDADRENPLPDGRTKPLWATWLGEPRPGGKDIDMWSTNDPEWGILSTPVIDPQKTTVWVVAWHSEGGRLLYRLHALNLRDGTHRHPPVVIGGDPPNAAQPCAYPGGFNPCLQKQRAAVLLSQGALYVTFGGDGNRGSIFVIDAASLQQRAVWVSTPTGINGGIWQSGQGPAADADGTVYLITGNGTFDANTGGRNYGDSFVKLKLANGALAVQDYFTPCNQAFLDGKDYDLGTGGAVLVPDTNLLYGEPVRARLQESERGPGIPGDGPAPAWDGGHLWPHSRVARLLEGAGSRSGVRVGREQSAEGIRLRAGEIRGRSTAAEHLSAAGRHAGRHAGGLQRGGSGGQRHPVGRRAARRGCEPVAGSAGNRAGPR